MAPKTTFVPGSLVSARGREWVVLPAPREFENVEGFLYVKPLDGSELEATGILNLEGVEEVCPASFAKPDPELVGDDSLCRFLRDALRFSIRSGVGPFRSFARYAFDPRPYQFAPLLLALRQRVPRLLIADDVGIGKTIETGMIIRELYDRGEIRRFCVLCPPHLADQWRRELLEKFQLDAVVVLPNTIGKLERENCAPGENVFDVFPFTIASLDFVKSDKRSDEFVKSAPELVVFDEAHAVSNESSASRHQRYALAKRICADPNRATLLVTATPHSGKASAFRSLLTLLDPKFADETRFPDNLSGKERENERKELARYYIQRRRADVKDFLDENTPFPELISKDKGWSFTPEYAAFFDRALGFARAIVDDKTGSERAIRLRWWSALSLMRALASSPAAAASTLRERNQFATDEGEDVDSTLDQIDEFGRRSTLDADATEEKISPDVALGVDSGDALGSKRAKLAALAREAENLCGIKFDAKLKALIELVKEELSKGFSPIIFCRFIKTVEYVAKELRAAFPKTLRDALTKAQLDAIPKERRAALAKTVEVADVSGELPQEERENRIMALADAPMRVLVCSDCLSEGINLQDLFNSTIHYDLSWNPTRHEQREGRVNRFGQTSPEVRSTTFYGEDDGIDGYVLKTLYEKHRTIKNSLGVSVALPAKTEELVKAIFDAFLKTGPKGALGKKLARSKQTRMFEQVSDYLTQSEEERLESLKDECDRDLDERAKEIGAALELGEEMGDDEENAGQVDDDGYRAKRQARSQTYFAHLKISRKADEIRRELFATRRALGDSNALKRFVIDAFENADADVREENNGVFKFDLSAARKDLREYLPNYDLWRLSFKNPAPANSEAVTRAHPLVVGLSEWLTHSALDPCAEKPLARRCGAIATDAVATPSALFLLRRRYKMTATTKGGAQTVSLAEDVAVLGVRNLLGDEPEFLDDDETDRLLDAAPTRKLENDYKKRRVKEALSAYDAKIKPRAREDALRGAAALKEAHERVREAAIDNRKVEVALDADPDLVGVYVLLPK